MAQVTVQTADGEHEFESKKEMLIQVGRWILNGSEQAMTLRQLYYRFVAHDLIENKQSQYQYLSKAIKEARIDGRISWDAIEDRTRSTDAGDWEKIDPDKRFERAFDWFTNTPDRHHRPRWEGQDNYVEVWVEKEALAGVFADVCDELKTVSFPNRGYTSITLLKQAAERFKKRALEKGKEPYILYFGDFDPSGQDIERNIRDKLHDTFNVPVNVNRWALTREQIDEFELPPQPAKKADARYESFGKEHGDMAVELDALPPEELRDLIHESVSTYFDNEHYESEVLPREKRETSHVKGRVENVLRVHSLD